MFKRATAWLHYPRVCSNKLGGVKWFLKSGVARIRVCGVRTGISEAAVIWNFQFIDFIGHLRIIDFFPYWFYSLTDFIWIDFLFPTDFFGSDFLFLADFILSDFLFLADFFFIDFFS